MAEQKFLLAKDPKKGLIDGFQGAHESYKIMYKILFGEVLFLKKSIALNY